MKRWQRNVAMAACVGLAALHVSRREADGILVMLPADHHIARPAAFRAALAAAAAVAERGSIATIGVRPTRPETGYGYIKAVKGAGPVLPIDTFVEKPDIERAAAWVAGQSVDAGMYSASYHDEMECDHGIRSAQDASNSY